MKQGWRIEKLGDYYDITSSKRVFESEWTKEGVPFYRAREIVKLAKQGFVENELFISEEMYNQYAVKYGIPKEGDIMVTGVGTLGICYVVKKNDRFYFKDGNIIWLKTKNGINSRYVEYAFRSDYLRKQIDDSIGATVGTFTIIKAKNTLIPLPPISEQLRIVALLDEAFASIAKAKANAEQNLKNARELFESYLNAVFSKKEEGWKEKSLNEVCLVVNGGTPDTKIPEYWNGKHLWITPKDMGQLDGFYVNDTSRKITDAGLKNSSAKLLPPDSIILSSRAPIGHLAINKKPISTNQGCKGLIPNKDTSTLFLFYFLKRSVELLNSLGTGATFRELSSSKLGEVLIPVPRSINEQLSIVKKLEDLSTETNKLEAIYQQKLNDLEELKKSILQKAFNGDLITNAILI